MNEPQDLGIELDEDLLGDLPLDRSVAGRVIGGGHSLEHEERKAKKSEVRTKSNP